MIQKVINFSSEFAIEKDNFSKLDFNNFNLKTTGETSSQSDIYFDNPHHSLGFDQAIRASFTGVKVPPDAAFYSEKCRLERLTLPFEEISDLGEGTLSTIGKKTGVYTLDNSQLEPTFLVTFDKRTMVSEDRALQIEIKYEPALYLLYNNSWTQLRDARNLVLLKVTKGDSAQIGELARYLLTQEAFIIPPEYYILCNEQMEFCAKQSQTKPYLELEATEIESKLSCQSERAYLEMYEFAGEVGLGHFKIEKNYPHLLARGLRVCYIKEHGATTKIVFYGFREPNVIVKSNLVVLNDALGLGCILKRSELKKKDSFTKQLAQSMLLPEACWLDKRKFAFWVENEETGRIYHIVHDKCQNNFREDLSQVEVEYAGTLTQRPPDEEAIIGDVACITGKLVERFSYLNPTVDRKEEWFAS